METISLMQIFGLGGFAAYVGNFAALQFGLIDGNSRAYSLISIAAATLVLLSLIEQFNLASALIQISWITIGIAGIIWKTRISKRSIVLSEINHRDDFIKLSQRLSGMHG